MFTGIALCFCAEIVISAKTNPKKHLLVLEFVCSDFLHFKRIQDR